MIYIINNFIPYEVQVKEKAKLVKFLEDIYHKHQEIKNSLLKHILSICNDDNLPKILEMLKVQDETSINLTKGQSSVITDERVKSMEIIKYNLLHIHKVLIYLH